MNDGRPGLVNATLAALQSGPRSAVQIEIYLAEIGYEPVCVNYVIGKLKREGRITHLRRGGRHVTSLYGLPGETHV